MNGNIYDALVEVAVYLFDSLLFNKYYTLLFSLVMCSNTIDHMTN